MHLFAAPTDMRKSFDGLSALVKHAMGLDPLSGRLFVFINRRATQMKVLYFDRSGFCVWAKRLEAGRLVSDWRQKVTWRPAQRPAATVVLKYVRPVIKRLAACRALEIEAEICLLEDRFSPIRRPIALLWVKNRRKYGPRRRIFKRSPSGPIQGVSDSARRSIMGRSFTRHC